MDIMELMAELLKENLTYSVYVVLFSQIGHCSLLWNSGTLTLNNVFNDSDMTPQYGTDSKYICHGQKHLSCMQREKLDL